MVATVHTARFDSILISYAPGQTSRQPIRGSDTRSIAMVSPQERNFWARRPGAETPPLSAPETGHKEKGDKKGRQPRPFFASLWISKDQPTEWWARQGSNL